MPRLKKDKHGTIVSKTKKAPYGYGKCALCGGPNVHLTANGRLAAHWPIGGSGPCPGSGDAPVQALSGALAERKPKRPKAGDKPWQSNVSSRYGAPMGRASDDPSALEGTRVHLQLVPFVDGDYDEGGAYWGGGTPLWCAWNDEGTVVYLRAQTRERAKAQLPGVIFIGSEPSQKGGSETALLEEYIDEFWRSYMGTALWSSNDESDERGGEPLDKNYTIDDIAPKTADEMHEDCAKFVTENEALLEGWPADIAGHCFWLDRNGHGTGFQDHDEGAEGSGEALSEKCNRRSGFGEVNLYVGDDSKIRQD